MFSHVVLVFLNDCFVFLFVILFSFYNEGFCPQWPLIIITVIEWLIETIKERRVRSDKDVLLSVFLNAFPHFAFCCSFFWPEMRFSTGMSVVKPETDQTIGTPPLLTCLSCGVFTAIFHSQSFNHRFICLRPHRFTQQGHWVTYIKVFWVLLRVSSTPALLLRFDWTHRRKGQGEG